MVRSARLTSRTGEFLTERSEAADKKPAKVKLALDATTRVLLGRLIRVYVKPQIPRIVMAVICMAIVAASTAAFPQLIKPIINEIFVSKNEAALYPIAIACLLVFAAKGIADYAQAVLMSFVGQRIVADVQTQLFERLIDAPLAFFHSTAPGTLIARFINDANLLRSAVSTSLTSMGKDALTLVGLTSVMFYEDWQLSALALIAFPTAILPILRVGRRMRKVAGSTQVQVGNLTTVLDEAFQGIRYVKAYCMEAYETRRASGTIDEVFELNVKAARTRASLRPIMEILAGLAIVAVLLYGGNQVIDEVRDPGSFFAFVFALLLAYEPVKKLARLHVNLQEGMAAAQRLFDLLDEEETIVERPDAKALKLSGGEITFERVDFSYDPEAPALHELSLAVPAGKTVALVGPSGAGKSTLLNLIPRFYDTNGGRVLVDGQDVRDVTLHSLRNSIALVSQEVLLFDDSVRANIAYGRPEASEEEIIEAARHAGAHDFITELPEGYDTEVGPRGSKLSGGQRQRIAIARAMVRDASILLLDEATSALDSESERKVQAALSTLMTGKTTVVIAHRLSTVVEADIIYVLDGGRVLESGAHAELLAKGGAYAKLYALQFAEQSEESEDSNGLRIQA